MTSAYTTLKVRGDQFPLGDLERLLSDEIDEQLEGKSVTANSGKHIVLTKDWQWSTDEKETAEKIAEQLVW
ncbi:hypothetical protein V866_008530 [Kwoniella sp. B9012]|uniref:Uncharacterized protein n=1 Tax=Kwoniella europaea PYCC6329 TaxID=1423913 RepID=A0AAX4KVD3_9TREE